MKVHDTTPIKLRIVSDGTVAGTRVIDIETGRQVANCTLVSWSLASDDFGSEAVISFWGLEADVYGTLERVVESEEPESVLPADNNVIYLQDFLKPR